MTIRRHYAGNGLIADTFYSNRNRAQISSSLVGRDGTTLLMADAWNALMNVVIVEAFNRISRD